MTITASDAVGSLYLKLLEAWNHRNAEGVASLFAEDGTMIGFDGSEASGTEVLGHLAPIFADHPTAAHVAKIWGRQPGPDNVMLRAIAGMVPPGSTS